MSASVSHSTSASTRTDLRRNVSSAPRTSMDSGRDGRMDRRAPIHSPSRTSRSLRLVGKVCLSEWAIRLFIECRKLRGIKSLIFITTVHISKWHHEKDPFQVEASDGFRAGIRGWNKSVQTWLALYVHSRAPKASR